MFSKLKKKIEEENQTELVIGIPPPPPQLPAPTPTHSRRASDCGVSTPGRSTCSEASDSDREQKPKKLSQGSTAENDNSKAKGSTPKRSAPTGADYEEIYHKLQLIKKEKQELERQLRESEQRVELLAGRCENREEIESFQSQEMAKVKHLLLCSQQELRAADERLRQRSQELQQARDQAAELEKALSEGGEQARARELERDKTALEAEVDRLKQDALQNATRISQLECELGGLTDEHDGLKHTHDVYKSKATTMIDEKDRQITDLEDKVHTLEKRLEGTALTGDEHIQSLVDERKELEKKLDESRQHLSEVKTSWSDKINNLEAQIFNLNQKMAEDSQECSRMEKLLAEAQQRLKDQQQQCAKLEEQLLARDTEMANMRRSHEEELQRQRALQDSQLDELRMQAADLRAQLTQAQRDRDRETSQAQARIVELNKKEAECRKSQERIQGLEASQQTSSEKVSKLERQLSLVSHSETTLKHSLKRSEAELKTMKEDLAKLKQELASAEMENKQLTEELEAKQQQANEQRAKLEEEVAQLQESLRSVTEKVEQLENEAAANASNSTSLADLESKVADLEDQVSEKNKMLKLQQQRISDMKKTLQKELKSHQGASAAAAALNVEGAPSAASDVPSPPVDHSSGLGSAGDSVVRVGTQEAGLATQPRGPDNKLEDDINFKYLKHVVFKFMTSKEYEAQHLIRAVSVLLRFTADEEQMIREHLDWKNSWFGTRPQPHHPPLHPLPQHHHGHNSHHHHHRSSAAFTNHPKGNTKTT
ncbi:golgin subfamily A member 1-like isoform X4 [Dermacentor silvarum]|uniref:golgin subfamily A member 1-like isoform X4 n=1 Tax=Dermacentor silvarum TaxID=543639 RepID=UPI00189A17AE|nr:golgin subfamily A member 1-like isoform X4 [Dermacentor silvarum]